MNQGKGVMESWRRGCHFLSGCQKGFHDQGTFENRLTGREGGSHVDVLGKIVELPTGGTKECPIPEAGKGLAPFEE